MVFLTITFILCLFNVANAHFRLLYPGPRGVFVANDEPNFCGGYTEVTTNRTKFPLSGGFFSIKAGHPSFTLGVIISTVQNPNSFDNFTVNGAQQFVNPFTKQPNPGTFCYPLDISAANITGVKEGSNVTVQVIFDGGDGNLYQCADLTLSASPVSPPSDVTCTNVTATSTATAPTGTTSVAAGLGLAHEISAYVGGLFGFVGLVAAFL